MNYLLLTTIISCLGCLLLGGYALKHDPKNKENIYFALFCLVTTLWLFFYYFSLFFTASMILIKITMFLATLQSAFLFLFVIEYSIFSIQKKWIRIYCIVSICVAFFTFSPYVFTHLEQIEGIFIPIPGFGMPLFAVFAIGSVISSFIILLSNIPKVDRINRIRTSYILLGFVLTMVSIMVSNFFGVIIFHTLYLSSFGMISVLFFIVCTTFAMTRYRFLDVKVVIKKSLVYGLALIAMSIIYLTLLLILFFFLFSNVTSMQLIIYSASSAALYLFLFQYFSKRIKRVLDGMFFREEIDMIKIVNDEKTVLHATHELESFILKLAGSIQEVIEAPVQQIFVIQKQYKKYTSFFPQHSKATIFFDDPVVKEIESIQDVILLEELKASHTAPAIEKLMKKYRAHIFFPVKTKTDILAIILIGKHKNARPFLPRHVTVLEDLQTTAQQSIPTLLYWQSTVENLQEHLKNQ